MKNDLYKENKTEVLTFKMTKSEKKALLIKCKSLNVSPSAYIRYVIEKDLATEES